MSKNNYSWNETLKFSWGHIIAFIALIFISYIAYMGDFYMNGGNFDLSALKVLLIAIGLLTTFIGAQIYKGADKKFDRSIKIERLLICLSLIVFILAMIPYNHFWNVHDRREQIETKFNSAIMQSRQMFGDYDAYAKNRIESYQQALEIDDYDDIQKNTYIRTLELQLSSGNYDNLKNEAIKWIDDSNQGVSVWNAFLVGNVEEIADAINTWGQTLSNYSAPILSNERVAGNQVNAFSAENESMNFAISELTSLISIYKKKGGVNLITIATAIVLFLMLLFPYILQTRNTKANGLYSLLPKREEEESTSPKPRSDIKENYTSSNDDDIYSGTF